MKSPVTKFVLALGILAAGLISLNWTEDVSATKVHLRVSPVSLEHDLDPGESTTGSFNVFNDGDNTLYYHAAASPYYLSSTDKGGLDVSYNKESTYTQIANWITFTSPDGEIAPGGKAEIKYKITVPKDAPGGGQYAALLVATRDTKEDAAKKDTSVSEVANVGPVVYAKISGDIITKGEITSNEINGFLFAPPITASSKVKNSGNVHADATYIMRVYPLFSNETIYNNEEHPGIATLLPDSTRYFTASWSADEGAPSIGIYRVQSEVKISDTVSKVEKLVIICPMWVLILIIIFILAVIFWIVSRVKARKAAA
ncbi:hypothetical protein IJH19_00420 [Candidatus Saccharibacteria bacterium]|nr:hypothetical protein [Candidatus Saccharibacteria bacterium]